MTPESIAAMEEIARSVEALLNTFTDMADRIKQRLMNVGWTDEHAEEFALGCTMPMVGMLMGYVTGDRETE